MVERRKDSVEALVPTEEIKIGTHVHVDLINDQENLGLNGFLLEFWSLILRQETAKRLLSEQQPLVPNLEKMSPHTRVFLSRALAENLHQQLGQILQQ